MASQQGWYWIGAGMLALGLTSSVTNPRSDWARDVRDRVMNTADRLSAETVTHVDLAKSAWCPRRAHAEARPEVAMARAEEKIACLDASLARRQAAFDRVEAAKIRILNRRMNAITVLCPRQKVGMRLPALPALPGEGTL
jgi:hypothetical protein